MLGLLFVGVIVTVLLLLNVFPFVPSSFVGWVALVIVGIPLYLLLEGLGEVLFSEKVGRSISEKDFSGARILFGVVVMLAFNGTAYLIWQTFGSYVRGLFGTWFD